MPRVEPAVSLSLSLSLSTHGLASSSLQQRWSAHGPCDRACMRTGRLPTYGLLVHTATSMRYGVRTFYTERMHVPL
jgi:hypothetical protein